jgi:Ca-activated chloride channel family protein
MTALLAAGFAAGIQGTLFGIRMRILEPLFLYLAPVALIAGGVYIWRSIQRQRALLKLVPEQRAEQLIRDAGVRQGTVRGSALGLGTALLCIAAAGPQCGEKTEVIKRSGIDLVIALDASTSMLARDVKPSRLERAKLEIAALLDKLKGDRVGLVVFAGEAFVQSPLTTDYSATKLFLRAIDPAAMPQQGTALADALRESKRVLEGGARTGAGKVVLMLSDGEDQEGEADAAATELGEAGIHLYTVAVGETAGEPIPLFDAHGAVSGYKKDASGKTVLTAANPAAMRDLASRGGGALLSGRGGDLGVQDIVPELDRMQRGELESRLSVSYGDRFGWFAGPAFALLALAAALSEGKLKWRRA